MNLIFVVLDTFCTVNAFAGLAWKRDESFQNTFENNGIFILSVDGTYECIFYLNEKP